MTLVLVVMYFVQVKRDNPQVPAVSGRKSKCRLKTRVCTAEL